jgi:hypothetical protein
MKQLIYFLLFSSSVFSQNYNYSLEEAQKKSVPAVTVNNQLEEIEYFKAILWPITKKATLQTALDTYGSVRLEKGDYSGVNIVMKSGQRLYGHSSINQVSNITIASGSTNVYLEDLYPNELILQPGGVISGCTFKSIKYSKLSGVNVMFENNLLINFFSRIYLDCSASGYFRNNKIIRHQVHGHSNQLVMKGNSTTPSYGNVHLHSNFLTPAGDATDIDGLQSATFVGLDSEGWNLYAQGTKAMFYAKNMGKIKITDFGGGNDYSPVILPSFDVDAQELYFLNKVLSVAGDMASPRTNVFLTSGFNGLYSRRSGTQTGFDYKAFFNDKKISYNGVDRNTLLTGQNALDITNSILETQYSPWASPTFETVPDPLGANWRAERVGKPDSTTYIQNLINTKGIAELPEGVFYISSTLSLLVGSNQGIIGKGTAKTVIVGLTDDFPLVTLKAIGSGDGSFELDNLTLQGGSVGLYANRVNSVRQINFVNMRYVTFRDNPYGIHLKEIYGLDNCFLNHISFVNCQKGFYQQPVFPYANNNDTTAYVDKVVFYKNQFINCETGVSMIATRGDNLNAWVDCKFDGGQRALDLLGHNFPIVANCIFENFIGTNVIKTNEISIYNSIFNNNSSGAIINAANCHIEGSKLLDNIPVFSFVNNNAPKTYLLNSIFNGNVIVPDNGQSYTYPSAIYMNSLLNANPTLSKLLVKVENKVPTVLLNATPTPYPQLLVTQ